MSGWTWVNQGSASVAFENSGHVWTQPAASANNLIGRIRPYTGNIVVSAELRNINPLGNFSGTGLGFRSASGQVSLVYWRLSNSNMGLENWASPTSFSSISNLTIPGMNYGFCMQVEDNGSNLIWRLSASGAPGTWVAIHSVGRTSFLTGGPVSVGWWGRDNNNANTWVLRSWLEE